MIILKERVSLMIKKKKNPTGFYFQRILLKWDINLDYEEMVRLNKQKGRWQPDRHRGPYIYKGLTVKESFWGDRKAGKQKPGIWFACSEEDTLEQFTLRGSSLRDSNPVNRHWSVKPRFCGFSQKGISFRQPNQAMESGNYFHKFRSFGNRVRS